MTKKQNYTLIILSIFATLSVALVSASTSSGALEVHFFDVGQGDAIFIETPNKIQVLIDGGPVASPILEKLSSKMPFYDRSIDLVIATHMDADHIGGLVQVLERFEIGGILVSSVNSDTDLSNLFFKIIKEKNIPVVVVKAGDNFKLDKDIDLFVLSPWEGLLDVSKDNDSSLVTKLTYRDDSFLFMGDAEKRVEYGLAQSKFDISSDVLKIGHHGSNTSSVKYFLSKVNPKLAIIQVGKNNYGHPHQAVLKRLSEIQVLRNDLNGDITIYSYGNSI